jgi:hypothetical protein
MSENAGTKSHGAFLAIWFLLALYTAARFLPPFADGVPIPVIAALHIFPPLLFAYLHGAFALIAWLRLSDQSPEVSSQ